MALFLHVAGQCIHGQTPTATNADLSLSARLKAAVSWLHTPRCLFCCAAAVPVLWRLFQQHSLILGMSPSEFSEKDRHDRFYRQKTWGLCSRLKHYKMKKQKRTKTQKKNKGGATAPMKPSDGSGKSENERRGAEFQKLEWSKQTEDCFHLLGGQACFRISKWSWFITNIHATAIIMFKHVVFHRPRTSIDAGTSIELENAWLNALNQKKAGEK